MGKKRQVDDNVSSGDQISHGFVSSVSDDKTSKHSSRDADVSTVSSEIVYSASHTSLRSDVSSKIDQRLNEKRKNFSLGTTEEISHGDSTIVVPYPHKQQKADSSSSKNSDAASMRSSHYALDLNEAIHESYHSGNAVLSEPIPVMAKMGVPVGLPRKPLQFGGDLGWKRSGVVSAFRSTPLTNTEKAHGSKGFDFDLNIAPTIDPEFFINESSKCASSKEPCIDLNDNLVITDACKTIYRQDETRQLLPVTTYTSNCVAPPYWVDLRSVRGFGNVQGQPFLLGGHTTEQGQIMLPIQMPYTPPGLYVGNMNGLTPTFYQSNVLPSFHNQTSVTPVQHVPARVLAAYPGNVRLLETSQAMNNVNMNPHACASYQMPTTVLSNGGRTGTPLFDGVVHPASSMKRRESDGVRDASEINRRHMASWN